MLDFTSTSPIPPEENLSRPTVPPAPKRSVARRASRAHRPVELPELPLFAATTPLLDESPPISASQMCEFAGDFLGALSADPLLDAGQRRKGKLSSRQKSVGDGMAPHDAGRSMAAEGAIGNAIGPAAALVPIDPAAKTPKLMHQAIENWQDLKPGQIKTLHTAVNHAEMIIESNLALLHDGLAPWSCAGLNRTLWARPPAAYGLSKDAFRNMLSGLRTVLIRLGVHADSGHCRNRLSPAWHTLYIALPTDQYRRGLIRFFRFCTLKGITPKTIAPDHINAFDRWCRTDILYDDPTGLSRRSAGNWEFARRSVPSWPQIELHRAGMRDHYALPWTTFPESFLADTERFLARLAAGPKSPFKAANPYARLAAAERVEALRLDNGIRNDHRLDVQSPSPDRPDRNNQRSGRHAQAPRTIDTRRWQIQVCASALVLSGVPAELITSLKTFVQPLDNVDTILSFHRERLRQRKLEQGEAAQDDQLRSSGLQGVGELLRQIGKYEARLPEYEMDELKDYSAFVSPETQMQMSEKNAGRLKALFSEPVYSMLLHLPGKWMATAADPKAKLKLKLTEHDAALLAMYATALDILLMLPLRRSNVLQLRLDRHLRRPSPSALISEIHIAAREVKNRTQIDWPVPPECARAVENYIRKYRPLLAKPGNPYLFPGISDSHRNECEFGHEFSNRVAHALGAEFNCHLVRHLSAVRFLRNNPGAYEIAANILGHKNPDTTRRFYCGLERDAAARKVNNLLQDERRATKLMANAKIRKPVRRRGGAKAEGDA